jgi:hypothetical protein
MAPRPGAKEAARGLPPGGDAGKCGDPDDHLTRAVPHAGQRWGPTASGLTCHSSGRRCPRSGGVPAVLHASMRRVNYNQGLRSPNRRRPRRSPRLRAARPQQPGARCPELRLGRIHRQHLLWTGALAPSVASAPPHPSPTRGSMSPTTPAHARAQVNACSPLHACCSGRPASEQARLQLLQPRALAASPVGASSSTKDFGRVARSLAVGVSCSFPAPYGGAAASPRPGARPPASPARVKRRRACAACPRPSASAAVRASAQRPGHTSPAAGASLQMPRPALLLLARPLRFRVRLSPANLAELRFRVRLSNVKPGARASRASLRPQHERACLSSGQWPRPYASAGYLARPLKVLAFILLLICTRLCLWFAFMYEDLICFHILSMKHCRYVGGYILNT